MLRVAWVLLKHDEEEVRWWRLEGKLNGKRKRRDRSRRSLRIQPRLWSAGCHCRLFTPFVVILVDHDVEAEMPTLFFWLNQAQCAKVGEVIFEPLMLRLG